MPMYYGYSWSWVGWIVMVLMMLLFWGGLAFLAVVLLRHFGVNVGGRPGPRSAPERALAERFAKGEIDEEEYRHRLEVLRS